MHKSGEDLTDVMSSQHEAAEDSSSVDRGPALRRSHVKPNPFYRKKINQIVAMQPSLILRLPCNIT